MSIRPKLFLTFAALCISALLVISLISFVSEMKGAERLLRQTLENESRDLVYHCRNLIDERERELKGLASGPLLNYVRQATAPNKTTPVNREKGSTTSEISLDPDVIRAVTNLPLSYANIACFDGNKRQLFLAQVVDGVRVFHTKDLIPGMIKPDDPVWSLKGNSMSHSVVQDPSSGEVWRSSLPIFLESQPKSDAKRGALVADLRLDQIFESIDRGGGVETGDSQSSRRLIVLDTAKRIVYHPNYVRNQLIDGPLPSFAHLAALMTTHSEAGSGEYRAAGGDTWMVAYRPVLPGLMLAVERNYSLASQSSRRAGWVGIALAVVLGSLTALLLTTVYQRKSQSLDRVTESVAAIVEGKLDQELLLRSSDDMRGLADNVNRMTERLRKQFAREAETKQFDSFARLSAMLAHDLKNAIEGLSLMVGNMERHFDNPRFRADAMHALTASTDKLRQLVARLSNPINTLSGEYKVPRPTDLVPLLRRVAAQIGEPLSTVHEIVIQLPPSLFALADGERLEKVMENLVLNAVEAMASQPGKLSIEAGTADGGKVFFSVADTGPGMSAEFIQQKLFHPFSTTKVRGVGLGLYTCREVVRANNGVIEVESKPNSGTRFRVVLASAQFQERAQR